MRSAGINFGIPESEWILEVEEDGSSPRCWNPVTGEELGSGGGDIIAVTVNPGTYLDTPVTKLYPTISIADSELQTVYTTDASLLRGPYVFYIPKYDVNISFTLSGADNDDSWYLLIDGVNAITSGDITWNNDLNFYIITGDCTINAVWIED